MNSYFYTTDVNFCDKHVNIDFVIELLKKTEFSLVNYAFREHPAPIWLPTVRPPTLQKQLSPPWDPSLLDCHGSRNPPNQVRCYSRRVGACNITARDSRLAGLMLLCFCPQLLCPTSSKKNFLLEAKIPNPRVYWSGPNMKVWSEVK